MPERGLRLAGGRGGAVASFALLCAVPAPVAAADPTRPGTEIRNVATLAYDTETRVTVPSNGVVLRVDAAIDVAVAAVVPVGSVAADATDIAVAFTVTNRGNLRETFLLAATAGDAVLAVVADGEDAPRVTLAAGETRTVHARLPGPVADRATVVLTATASLGHGRPGTTLPGAGPDGSDAVLGRSGGRASAEALVATGGAAPTLAKSQSVRAPNGSTRVMPGSVVTYRLDAGFPSATAGVEVVDAVPAGTRYVAGSVTLDGVPLTDADDGDAASFDGTAVRVRLGDLPAGAARTIQFRTTIE